MSKNEENLKYLKLARSGDKSARDWLVLNNQGLISYVLKSYPFLQDREDLRSVGQIALLNSIDNFDFTKDTKFSTYAFKSIRSKIYRCFKISIRGNEMFRLDSPIFDSENDDERCLVDKIEDKKSELSYEDIETKDSVNYILKLANRILTEKEKDIFIKKFNDNKLTIICGSFYMLKEILSKI